MTHVISPHLSKKCMVVIPSIEGWHLLSRLLPSIDLPRNQIFVVDQGSQDQTEQKCREMGVECIQMHSRATFTEAVNRGVKEVLDRKAEYVLILNNDIEFQTPVASQLLKRAEIEVNLGILAPRQVICEGKHSIDIKRCHWDLTKIEFKHEYDDGIQSSQELLESDFCEFTCVLIDRKVFETIGLLDDRYEFYHEDTDFCFRAQAAGFRCAYDLTAQIKHWPSSTFNKQKIYDKSLLIKRNKMFFAQDHLNQHVDFSLSMSTTLSSWNIANEFLRIYLNKYGLLNSYSPSLSNITHPQIGNYDYLYTVWETTQLPHSWINELKKFKHIFVPSLWNKEVFEKSGFNNVSTLPFGIEPDIFNPWGPRLSFPWSKSILYICQNQYRKALDVTLNMWNQIRAKHPGVFLVLYGKDVPFPDFGKHSSFSLRMGNFIVKIDSNNQIALLEPASKEHVSHSDMAILYRSCEIFLLNSRSEGFGYSIIEAMACAAVCVIPNYGAVKELVKKDNCISFRGSPIAANYLDQGFSDVGEWWEPDLEDLISKMDIALNLDKGTAAKLGHLARQSVLSHFTWRHVMVKLRKYLYSMQKCSIHNLIIILS